MLVCSHCQRQRVWYETEFPVNLEYFLLDWLWIWFTRHFSSLPCNKGWENLLVIVSFLWKHRSMTSVPGLSDRSLTLCIRWLPKSCSWFWYYRWIVSMALRWCVHLQAQQHVYWSYRCAVAGLTVVLLISDFHSCLLLLNNKLENCKALVVLYSVVACHISSIISAFWIKFL